MKISIKCTNPKCGRTLLVDREFVGRQGKCPTCGMVMIIRDPAAMEEKPKVFSCRKCGAKLRVARGDTPKVGQCPKCGQKIRVPARGEGASSAAPSTPISPQAPPPAATEPTWEVTEKDTWEYTAFRGALEVPDIIRASQLAREKKIHPDLVAEAAQEVFDSFLAAHRPQDAMGIGAEFGLDLTRAHEALLAQAAKDRA